MSIRRTQQTIERLWHFTMEAESGHPFPHANHGHHVRQSPPPNDPEMGYKEHPGPIPELSAASMQPPRLQGAGCCSRFVATVLCCFCLGGTGLAWSIIISMPSVEAARGAFVSHVIAQPAEPPKPKPIPAILRRFALIKRAAAPQKGADPQSVQSAFPHWGFPDNLSTDAFVSDLSLAVSALVARLDPPVVEVQPVKPRARTSPPPSPPLPSSELADPNALSVEDGEL